MKQLKFEAVFETETTSQKEIQKFLLSLKNLKLPKQAQLNLTLISDGITNTASA